MTIYYPFNKTFSYYAEPRAGKRAQQFIDNRNAEKNGIWVLHTKQQHDSWYEKIGKHLEYLKNES